MFMRILPTLPFVILHTAAILPIVFDISYFNLFLCRLLNTFAEEQATADAIYYLQEGLKRGVIDLDVFLKVCNKY